MYGRTGTAVAAVGVALVLAGCGIRGTSVPVDAGPGPSRVACAVPRVAEPTGPGTEPRQVYLVCGSQIAPVERLIPVRSDPRDLLGQLQRSPLPQEATAGFTTSVPGFLTFARPAKGDPAGALRLSRPLDELPAFALAEIVCTLADATGHAVLLGGPAPASEIRSYTCTSDLRTRPEAADSAGSPLPKR